MDHKKETSKLINEKVIMDLLYGDKDYFNEFVMASIESFSEFREHYNLSVQNNDLQILRDAGHKIKPAAQMMKLDRLLELYDLSKEHMEKDHPGQINPFIREMNSYSDQLLTELQNMLSG